MLPPGSVAKPALEPVASTMSNGCKLGLEPTPGPEPRYAEEVGDGGDPLCNWQLVFFQLTSG